MSREFTPRQPSAPHGSEQAPAHPPLTSAAVGAGAATPRRQSGGGQDPGRSPDLERGGFRGDGRRRRTDVGYATALGNADAVKLRKAGALSSEQRADINAKRKWFQAPAHAAYVAEIGPALSEVEGIDMSAEAAADQARTAERARVGQGNQINALLGQIKDLKDLRIDAWEKTARVPTPKPFHSLLEAVIAIVALGFGGVVYGVIDTKLKKFAEDDKLLFAFIALSGLEAGNLADDLGALAQVVSDCPLAWYASDVLALQRPGLGRAPRPSRTVAGRENTASGRTGANCARQGLGSSQHGAIDRTLRTTLATPGSAPVVGSARSPGPKPGSGGREPRGFLLGGPAHHPWRFVARTRAGRRAHRPIRTIRQDVVPLLARQVAAGDLAGEALQGRAVERPLDRAAELGYQQPAARLERHRGDQALRDRERVADARARADVPHGRGRVLRGDGKQPPVGRDGELGDRRTRHLGRRAARPAGVGAVEDHVAVVGPGDDHLGVGREGEAKGGDVEQLRARAGIPADGPRSAVTAVDGYEDATVGRELQLAHADVAHAEAEPVRPDRPPRSQVAHLDAQVMRLGLHLDRQQPPVG